MVRTTIDAFSLDSGAGPYLYACVRATYVNTPCVVCVSCEFVNLYLLCNAPSKQSIWVGFVSVHCWGVWLSCVCQNELTIRTTGSLNVMAIFIQPWHTLCLALSDPISEWGLEYHQRERKLGQAQMDRLFYSHADMWQAVSVLCKWPPVCHSLNSAWAVLSSADIKGGIDLRLNESNKIGLGVSTAIAGLNQDELNEIKLLLGWNIDKWFLL